MRRLVIALLACGALAGCGSSGNSSQATTAATTAAKPTPAAELEHAVQVALEQNEKVSGYVLWHNTLPANASQSTAGPALAGLRASGAQRKAQHVRVRSLSGTLKVRSIQLDPSYQSAIATIVTEGRVRVYKNGRAIGRPKTLKEPARMELHRVASKTQFVDWKVTLIK